MPAEFPRIAVIVCNWNEVDISVVCLRSVLAATYPNLMSVLVDNGSDEDPTEVVRSRVPSADVVRLATNRGYAAALNAGAKHAIARGAEYLLLLNNDATIDERTLPGLLTAAISRPAGIFSPMIVYAHNPAEIWSAGGYLVRPWMKNYHFGEGGSPANYAVSRTVDWATGCALFVSTQTFHRLGPLDEDFFLYLEDVDWCLRGAKLGIETRYVPEAVVRHEVSTTVARRLPAHVRYYAYRNYYRVAFRYAPVWARPVIASEVGWTLLKITIRWALFPRYRHDFHYHARTDGVLDFLRGRWGQAPRRIQPTFARKSVQAPIAETVP